jgi:magnesium-transporting ATPase (P-type)
LGNPTLKKNFLKIAKTVDAVICCRVSPSQKADVVRLIKEDDPHTITLAIGDGANDVSMIREAHIGIGLFGHEGLRAAQSADIAIGEFKCLWKILFWHGRVSYMRNAELINYFFYKNILFTFPQILFFAFNYFSNATIYDEFYITCYNMLFTIAPCGIRALSDFVVHPDLDRTPKKTILNQSPKLYYVGRLNTIFNSHNFAINALWAMLQATALYFIPFMAFTESSIIDGNNGQTADFWLISSVSGCSVLIVGWANLLINTRYFTWVLFLSVVFSIATW